MKLVLAAIALVAATAANAAGPCGADTLVTMRVSKLNAAGTPAGFHDAVKDHKAWYASHGFQDDVFITGPSVVAERGGMKPSASSYVTFHVYSEKEPKHDAAWDAYVAKYKANSTIESDQRFCLPKGAMVGR